MSFFIGNKDLMLKPNIRIWSNTSRINSKIYISQGTCPANGYETNDIVYLDNSRVPKGPLRPAVQEELDLLVTNKWRLGAQSVGVLELLSLDEIPSIQTLDDWVLRGSEGDISIEAKFAKWLALRARGKLNFSEIIKYHRVCMDKVNLTTVSFDPVSCRYVGLHLDTWPGMPIGFNRLCVNLGPYPRLFLFIPQPLKVLLQLSAITRSSEHKNIARVFMENFPSYPVIGVKIDPGWAYLAPTTQIVHDAACPDAEGPIYHLAMWGDFVPTEA